MQIGKKCFLDVNPFKNKIWIFEVFYSWFISQKISKMFLKWFFKNQTFKAVQWINSYNSEATSLKLLVTFSVLVCHLTVGYTLHNIAFILK